MKETQIPRICLQLRRGLGDSPGNEQTWQIASASHDKTQIPREILALVFDLGQWGNGFDRGGEGLILCHKGRWSIVVLASANLLELAALKKADFARYFAADPFRVAKRLERGAASCSPGEVTWTVDPEWGAFPRVAYFQDLLKSADSALLLGGAQALMDGAKLRLDAGAEDREVAERLWNLAPLSVRLERTLVVGDPGNAWQADLAALQPSRLDDKNGPNTERDENTKNAQALPDAWTSLRLGDYPEGKYELSLHFAIDQGDEAAIHRLLHRQSPRQVMMMAGFLLAGMIVIGILMAW